MGRGTGSILVDFTQHWRRRLGARDPGLVTQQSQAALLTRRPDHRQAVAGSASTRWEWPREVLAIDASDWHSAPLGLAGHRIVAGWLDNRGWWGVPGGPGLPSRPGIGA
jgi:hypothetical protein